MQKQDKKEDAMQELMTVTAAGIGEILLLEEHARAVEPAGGMWFPPEFFEYFTLEQ